MPEVVTKRTTITMDTDDTFVETLSVSGNNIERVTPSIPAAKTGALTTRTDDNTGVLTMDTGHGFVSTNVIDVFWSGGSRRAMTATVVGDAVSVDGGSGDVLPADETDITAMLPVEVLMDLDGDNAVAVAVKSPKAGYIVFVDDADAEITDATYQVDANEGKGWVSGDGGTNPLTGDIVTLVKFSHGYSSAAVTMTAAVIINPV